MTDKLYQIESETGVISLILKIPDLFHSADGLRYFMFSSTPHQIIFQEFEELAEKRMMPDPILVIESLESKKLIDSAGGKAYVEILLSKDFNEGSFSEFVRLVKDSYKARNFVSIVAGVRNNDISTANIDEFISNTRRSLEGLSEIGGGSDTLHVGDIAKSTYDEIMARTKNPGIRGASWGIPSLDVATGGKTPGDFWAIGARPGQGKTAMICNSILTDGVNGIPSLLIEREMRAQELMERLICIDTGIPNTNLRLGVLNQEQVDKVYKSLAKLKKLPIYIDTNYKASDPYYLEGVITKFHNKFGIKNVYLDYIQLLAERDEGQTQEIGRLTRMFKLLANGLGVCSIILSQLNRGVESRDNKRPLLSDMKQSGAIEEDVDFAVGLYRDEYYNIETKYKGSMEFLILKNRNGPPGTVPLHFDGPTYKITDG